MLKQVLFSILLLGILGFSLGSRLTCSEPGQCIDGTLITVLEASTEKECLGNCKNTTECWWYTYLRSPLECELFKDCSSVSTDNCASCVTGEVDCTINECGLSGICQGNLDHQETDVGTELDCLNLCKAYDYCKWYSYETDKKICFIFENCPTLNEDCSACVSGEQGCTLSGGGSMKLMITNGWNGEGEVFDTEVIELENSNKICDPLPDYPIGVDGTNGALLDGKTPIVCGGEFRDSSVSERCFKLDPESRNWDEVASMKVAREEAATIALDSESLWITGGFNDNDGYLATTEVAKPLVSAPVFGPDLPYGVSNHCLLKLNSSKIMLIGGTTISGPSNRTLFADISADGFAPFSEGPSMERGRDFSACGLLSDGSSRQVVVVAGGGADTFTASTELLDLGSSRWIAGPDLPKALKSAVGISSQDGKSFFVVGGYTGSYLTDIYRLDYSPNTEDWQWVLADSELAVAREWHFGMLIPDSLTNCTESKK